MEHDYIDFICPMCSDIMETSLRVGFSTIYSDVLSLFLWNNTIEGLELKFAKVSLLHDGAVHRERNFFLVPNGKAGHEFKFVALF